MRILKCAVVFTFIFIPAIVLAVTQVQFFVNGVPATSIIQGDTLVWQADCAMGGTVWFELWMDLNQNQQIDPTDVRLFRFSTTDGDSTGEGGPPDIDGMNGYITSSVGAFGFAPISWIFYAEEGATNAYGALQVIPMPNPPGTVSGTVSFEDGHSPANVLVATSFDEPPFWNALTDAQGNYTINIGEIGRNYEIETFYNDAYYLPPEPQVVFVNGPVTGVNFVYHLPECQIVGDLMDEQMNPLPIPVGIAIEDMVTGDEVQYLDGVQGHYRIGLTAGHYRFNFDDESLNPMYLAPDSWRNTYFQFTINAGDSLVKDIMFYRADTALFARVLMNGVPVSQPKLIPLEAVNDTVGRMKMRNDAQGMVRLPVKSGYTYEVHLRLEDVPPGFGVPGGNTRFHVHPGDTVEFNITSFTEHLSGSLSLDPGDPQPDYTLFTVYVEKNGSIINTRQVNPDGSFSVEIPADTVEVGLWRPTFYLIKPEKYLQALPGDSLIFEVNFANAVITGRLYNLPEPPNPQMGVYGHTSGSWPNTYNSWAAIQQDSTYILPVCEGTWEINPPYFWNYNPDPPMAQITVPETDTTIVVDFHYYPLGIGEDTDNLPREFALHQNYPNPFNPGTTIRLDLPEPTRVKLEVYNILGQRISTLADEKLPAGVHQFYWDASGLPSGIYFYRLEAPGIIRVKKMIYTR